MYNILIVDDEPVIVDGLYDLFLGLKDVDLQLHKAYSADEALDIVYKTHVDVAFTDIRMPGMDGMELHRRIAAQWPFCKVVFLTGYNDFDYIQSVFRQGGTDYILKTESFEVVEQSLRKAIREIAELMQKERMIERARERMKQAMPVLQREFLLGHLEERAGKVSSLAERFAERDLPLDADSKVLIVIGRVDAWDDRLSESDKHLLLYAIENISSEYLASVRVQIIQYERSKLIWLIQPVDGTCGDEDKNTVFVQGTLDAIQSSCKELLQLSISFIAAGEFVSWEEAPDKFHELRGGLVRGMGQASGIILIDGTGLEEEGMDDGPFRRLLAQSDLLEHHLENGSSESCYAVIRSVVSFCETKPPLPHLQQEAFFNIALRLLSYLNRSGLSSPFARRSGYDKLLDMEAHESWKGIGMFFESVVTFILENRIQERDRLTHRVVSTINRHIQAHFSEDLSLTRLSGIVHLNPSYLCRLYKQTTGIGLSDYINQYRIAQAKEMLKDPYLKIQDLAVGVGFDSSAYFGRVFKKATQMTPQEYRDSLPDLHS
ncbi:response regulator transcription factor [Cohnella nanjingensis]|uniref:Response regulator n=1 Tax=Cohnella nanjingensis TaxID=1387779 RepID=A0A7X0RMV7_9BACL|nr:response regulator [Cohnella nanjingensis]MBB6670198.1 response regulator [Cohnella nanjingensis]